MTVKRIDNERRIGTKDYGLKPFPADATEAHVNAIGKQLATLADKENCPIMRSLWTHLLDVAEKSPYGAIVHVIRQVARDMKRHPVQPTADELNEQRNKIPT